MARISISVCLMRNHFHLGKWNVSSRKGRRRIIVPLIGLGVPRLMPRKLQVRNPGAIRHVMNRDGHREPIFINKIFADYCDFHAAPRGRSRLSVRRCPGERA